MEVGLEWKSQEGSVASYQPAPRLAVQGVPEARGIRSVCRQGRRAACWHRACFACQACGQALINRTSFHHDGHLYCSRHQAELLRHAALLVTRHSSEWRSIQGPTWQDIREYLSQYQGMEWAKRLSLGPLCFPCSDLSSGHVGPFASSLTAVSLIFSGIDSFSGGGTLGQTFPSVC